MCYKKLYILLLLLPIVVMAVKTTKVLQRGLDGYNGAQDAGLFWRFKTDDRKPGYVFPTLVVGDTELTKISERASAKCVRIAEQNW